MAHPKITQTITFTDSYGKELGLSPKQVEEIDELDYLSIRDYTFSIDPDYSEKKALFSYCRGLLNILNAEQVEHLYRLRKKKRLKNRKFKAERGHDRLFRWAELYKPLGLQEKEFDVFIKKLLEIKELVHEEIIEGIGADKPKIERNECFSEMANDMLVDVLNEKQLIKFNQIREEDELYYENMHCERIIAQYLCIDIQLNEEQALKIYQYEENEPSKDANGEYLSEFEKSDLEASFLKSLLNDNQYKTYLPHGIERRKGYIRNLKEGDIREMNKVNELKKRKDYLIHSYLPVKCDWRKKLDLLLNDRVKENIDRLREDYYNGLSMRLARERQQHKRHSKEYCPNKLEQIKFQYLINGLAPCVGCSTDEQEALISQLSDDTIEFMLKENIEVRIADEKLHNFIIENYENNGGTYGGWITVLRRQGPQNRNVQLISDLLLHPILENNVAAMLLISENK